MLPATLSKAPPPRSLSTQSFVPSREIALWPLRDAWCHDSQSRASPSWTSELTTASPLLAQDRPALPCQCTALPFHYKECFFKTCTKVLIFNTINNFYCFIMSLFKWNWICPLVFTVTVGGEERHDCRSAWPSQPWFCSNTSSFTHRCFRTMSANVKTRKKAGLLPVITFDLSREK